MGKTAQERRGTRAGGRRRRLWRVGVAGVVGIAATQVGAGSASAAGYQSYVLLSVNCSTGGWTTYTGSHPEFVHKISTNYWGIDLLPGRTQPVSWDGYCAVAQWTVKVGSISKTVSYGTDYYWRIG